MLDKRTDNVSEKFSQDWEVYLVLSSDLKLATYVELDTVCNVEDLNNMLEIIEAKAEFDEIARLKREQEANTK